MSHHFCISRNRAFTAPKARIATSADIARKRRSTDWLQTDARPSRDGSERSSGPARKHAISVYGFYSYDIYSPLLYIRYPRPQH